MRLLLQTAVATLILSVGSAAASNTKLPSDVAKYIDQREGCDHFRGEFPDPPDEQRMREIEHEIRKLCTGTDKKLAQLKRKYAKNQAVMKRLNEFEDKIE